MKHYCCHLTHDRWSLKHNEIPLYVSNSYHSTSAVIKNVSSGINLDYIYNLSSIDSMTHKASIPNIFG